MSLSRNEINPLSVLELRRLSFIPKHFSKLTVNDNSNVSLLDQWINYNLNSRYSITTSMILDENNQLSKVYEIGMEDPKELLILALGCPYFLNKN
jgi:hypothetical protein